MVIKKIFLASYLFQIAQNSHTDIFTYESQTCQHSTFFLDYLLQSHEVQSTEVMEIL